MEEVCRECDFDVSTATLNTVADALPPLAATIVATVRALPEALARRRPSPTVWSPLEYLGHLRESMAFHRWLIEMALAEDDLRVGMVDPDESVNLADYNAADEDELIGQFERRVGRLRELLTTLAPEAGERALGLGDTEISVALVARSAWHECHHHCGDIARLARMA